MSTDDLSPTPSASAVPRYDDRTRAARLDLARAKRELDLYAGTQKAFVAWKRLTHSARLRDAQGSSIHRIYALSERHQICTCSLLIPRTVEAPFAVAGHVSLATWQPVGRFICEPVPKVVVADRTYAVRCQECDYTGPESSYAQARALIRSHDCGNGRSAR